MTAVPCRHTGQLQYPSLTAVPCRHTGQLQYPSMTAVRVVTLGSYSIRV